MNLRVYEDGIPGIAADARWLESRQNLAFTNGCFAGIHAGHIGTLYAASAHGSLIVAFNSVESIVRLKGYSRKEIIPDTDRGIMLSVLPCVRCAVVQDEDDPCFLIRLLRPKVLYKGGTTGDVVGREVVESYGGRVVVGPVFAGGLSFSSIRRLDQEGSK